MPKDVHLSAPGALVSLVCDAQNTGESAFKPAGEDQIAVFPDRALAEAFPFDLTQILVDAFSFICRDHGLDACVGISGGHLVVCLSNPHRKPRRRAASIKNARRRVRSGDYDMRAAVDGAGAYSLNEDGIRLCARILAFNVAANLAGGYSVVL